VTAQTEASGDVSPWRFSVAPMMDWTDRHCRVFHRLLSARARLYTEMVTTGAVLHGPRERLLGFSPEEQPVALQLGGSDPQDLARAARIAEEFGYAEVNLNVGCPSDRVQDGRFGACLMREPALVGACVAAMKAAVGIPVTVKCRIGVDDQDPEAALDALTLAVREAGVDALVVHARKAWLQGLSPKENRADRYKEAFAAYAGEGQAGGAQPQDRRRGGDRAAPCHGVQALERAQGPHQRRSRRARRGLSARGAVPGTTEAGGSRA
jgi:tRNA-dihydrouridine synthase A